MNENLRAELWYLDVLHSPWNGYSGYRKTLKEVQSPCLPNPGKTVYFMGILIIVVALRDLNRIMEGTRATVRPGLLNLKIPEQLGKVLAEIDRFQHQGYAFPRMPDLEDWICNELVQADGIDLVEMARTQKRLRQKRPRQWRLFHHLSRKGG